MPNTKTADVLGTAKRFLIFGPAGSGKTTSLRTAPKPCYVLSLDDKLSSLVGEDVEFDTFQGGNAAGFIAVRDKLLQLRQACAYKTIAVDSFTALSRAAMHQVRLDNDNKTVFGKAKMEHGQDYGSLYVKLDEIGLYLADIREKFGTHIILICHEYADAITPDGPRQYIEPLIDGVKYPNQMLAINDEILHQEILPGVQGTKNYVWRTRPTAFIRQCSTRFNGMEEFEPADFTTYLAKAKSAAAKLQGGEVKK